MVGRNLLEDLRVVLELYEVVEIAATFRLAAKMAQNSYKRLGAEEVFFFEHVLL